MNDAKTQLELFEMVWNERADSDGRHRSEISGEPLDWLNGRDMFVNCFAHILSKAKNKYPKFKFYKKNIMLMTPEEHHLYDHGNSDQRRRYEEKYNCSFDVVYDKAEELKQEYLLLEQKR